MKKNRKSTRYLSEFEWEAEQDAQFDGDYPEYSYNQQCYIDRLNYAQELYESGKIDETQRAEMRMGA